MSGSEVLSMVGILVNAVIVLVIVPMRSDIKDLAKDNKSLPKDYVNKDDYKEDKASQEKVNENLYTRMNKVERACAANHKELR